MGTSSSNPSGRSTLGIRRDPKDQSASLGVTNQGSSSQDINTASPTPTEHQQLAIKAFSPEQDAVLDERFNDINANMATVLADLARQIGRLSEQLNQQQQTSSPVLPFIETSPPTPQPALPPPPTSAWSPYKNALRAEDVGYFDPDFKPSEQEHGNTTPGPVVNVGKHAYYLDVFVFVDYLNEQPL